MADVFDFYVRDNRKITFEIAEPIMREDSGVTDFVFHIPKSINNLDMSDWQWWFVFVNANKEKYSIALTLSDDPERPLEYNLATYTVDYAMSIKAGSVQFALEAINTGTGGAIDNEWHTLTYETKVKETLQGNQAEYAETESDIISALLEEVRTKMNQVIGGATPEPVQYKAQMTDPKAVYLYIGSEPDESTGYWYYYNGTQFVPGGKYGAGIVDDIDAAPTKDSENVVQSGGTYDAIQDVISLVGIKDVFSGETSVDGLPETDKTITLTTDYFNEKFYTTKLNALPVRGAPATLNGVTWTPVENHYELSGAYTSGYFMFDWENIFLDSDIVSAGDEVVFCIKADITLKIWVRDNSGNLIPSTSYDPTSDMVKVTFTLPSTFTKMRITVFATDTTYAGTSGKVWFGLYKSDAVFTPCETSFVTNSPMIDTLYNLLSFEEIKNTKDYVDGAVATVESGITVLSDKIDDGVTFLTPEMFGAVGDGNADDTVAFQACINAAIPNKTPIRAEKRYKTTATLSVVGEYQDIKINELKYTGTAHAIEFTCTFSKIEIGRVLATSTGAVGIVFTDRASGSPDRCQSNYCIIGTLWTNSNCMEFRFVANHYAYYNEFHLRRCYSANANIIYIDNTSANALAESTFYGAKYLSCANGYVVYIKDCATSQARFYEFAFEGDCRNGIYGVTNLINCRTAEMLDRWTEADPRGYLFKVKDQLPNGMFAENTRCDFLGIDMSEAITWEGLLQQAREGVDNDWTASNMYYHFGTNFDQFILDYCNRVGAPGHFANNTQRLLPQGKLKIVYDKVIFIPNKRTSKTIDTASFEPYTTDYTFPTDFAIEENCTITLNNSYCCVGIDNITVEQKNGKKATVIDKSGNTIFNGSDYPDGVYNLTCVFVPLGRYVINGIETQKSVTLEAYSTANIYTGTNERWILT